jgi:hypothetical protein
MPLPALTSTSIHAGKPRDSAASKRCLGTQMAAGAIQQLDDVTGTHAVGRNIHPLAVDQHAVVAHDLTSFGARNAKPMR